MPKKNKYKALCQAYKTGVEECNNYRKECREFAQELRSSLIETLNCRETKVFMFQPTQGFIFKSSRLQGDAFDTEFADNGVALIGFAINVNGDDPEDKFFTFIVTFTKEKEHFIFKILDDEKEFDSKEDDVTDFCEHIFEVAQKNLSERLKIFLKSPTEESAPIGFKVNNQ